MRLIGWSLVAAALLTTACSEGGGDSDPATSSNAEALGAAGSIATAPAAAPEEDEEVVIEHDPFAPKLNHVPGRVIVQLTPELTDRINEDASRGLPSDKWRWSASLERLYRELGVKSVEPVLPLGSASPEKLEALRETYAKRHGRVDRTAQLPRLDAFFVFELDKGADLDSASSVLAGDPDVLSTEFDVTVQIAADTYANTTQQWGLFQINAPAAWNISTGAGINVAVVDTGVHLGHPDLQGKLLPGATFVPNTSTAQDDNGHGTHVAGVIAAVTNNNLGIAAVAPNAMIIPVKALNAGGSGQNTWLQNAYFWAMSTGQTDIINNSWGGSGTSPMMDQHIRTAHQLGILTVNAAGNASTTTYGFFPSNVEYGLSVAATDINNAHAAYSNTGVKLDVAAPGGSQSGTVTTGVLSTVHGNFNGNGLLIESGARYAPLAGTSMAAPHVAGLAALVMSARPTWSVEQVRQAIRKGAVDVGAPGFDVTSGYGRINATNTLAVAHPPTAQLINPRNATVVMGSVPVTGFALPTPANTASWTLRAGAGTAPTSWTTIASSSSANTSDATLANFNTLNVADGDVTLQLVTTNNAGGMTAEDRNLVHVDNVAISFPAEGDHLTQGTINVFGRVRGNLGFQSRTLAWAPGFNATSGFTTFHTSTAQANANTLLGTWSLASVPEGEITLRLTAQFSNHVSTHQVNVIVDKRVLPGFPTILLDSFGGFKSPKIADLDRDGMPEIVVGNAVYNFNGTLKQGWTPNPRLGRTVPAIVNVDSQNDLEVINATFDAYYHDPALPNGGATVVTATKSNGTVLWAFPVTHTVGTFHNGTPSSVSVSNVIGDSRAEVVFTHFFAYNNNPWQTAVFVLDAQTGTQLSRFNVPGVSYSSVALADLNADGRAELVLSTRDQSGVSRVHAYNGAGVPLAGFPQVASTSAGGGIAPVLADVDGNCRHEILVGSSLFRHTGAAMTGWPVANISRANGAFGNLDSDGALEVVLGAGNSVTSWVMETNATLKSLTMSSHENLHLIWALNDTTVPGHPLIADVDGDGRPDVILPSEKGSTNPLRSLPLYAYDSLNGAVKTQTRRVRTTLPNATYSQPIYSTAAVGDVNMDGKLDLVMVARGQLWAWDMGVSFSASTTPWPMYQRDLLNTGAVPLGWQCPIVAEPWPGHPVSK